MLLHHEKYRHAESPTRYVHHTKCQNVSNVYLQNQLHLIGIQIRQTLATFGIIATYLVRQDCLRVLSKSAV
jgi:hypothetical protein